MKFNKLIYRILANVSKLCEDFSYWVDNERVKFFVKYLKSKEEDAILKTMNDYLNKKQIK
jgi:ribosomal protein L12E/L44/L45/RPP1/RPP2